MDPAAGALIDWSFAWTILPRLAEAAGITLFVTAAGYAVALAVGLLFAILRRSHIRAVALPTGLIVELIRSTPLLIQIYFIYYVFPQYGVILPALAAGTLGIALHYGCYLSEVYRAGLEAVPRGQWEAATALNLGPWRRYRDVILPQAIPPIVPALGNYLVSMFKDTPLLSAIAVVEVMQRAKIIGSETFRYLEPVTMVGLFFLAVSLISAAGIRRVERRLRHRWS